MTRWLRRRLGQREEGTALLTALLMTALMAVVAVELVDQTRFAMFRTGNGERRDQAYWYAMGARDFSESVLLRSGAPNREVMRPIEPWLGGPQTFPIEGGMLTGHVRDGNNCLNLNALTGVAPGEDDDPPVLTADDTRAMFSTVLERSGIPPGVIEALKAQIVDWTDANTYREPDGAEDEIYVRFDPPLRAANQPMSELEELLVLPAMTPELFAAVRPLLCVRPVAGQPPLNVNTLRLDQAVLLTALFEGRLSVGEAEAVLLQRPPAGYDAVSDFFDHPLIAALQPDPALHEAVTLRTRWFDIDVGVRLGETVFSLSETVELDQGGRLIRHYQRFGAIQ